MKKSNWAYSDALKLAETIKAQLSPYCDKIDIAGSIRRRSSLIGDIEIVCLPKQIQVHKTVWKKGFSPDIFGELTVPSDIIDYERSGLVNKTAPEFMELVNSWEKVKGEPDGRYTQRMLPQGIKLDIFMPQAHDYYRIFAMRTGSPDFSLMIAKSWVARGWRGTDDGLRLEIECVQKGGKWYCEHAVPTLPPVWQSEHEFFAFIKLGWTLPERRY